MKAISVRQPWAWLIIHKGKDVENRNWPTKLRGRVLIHAAKGMTQDEYLDVWHFVLPWGIQLPAFDALERGGIIGSVEIMDCITSSSSVWFSGKYGFWLQDPIALPFRPFRGALGFFDVPEAA
jgi:hypothetical protein